MARVIIKSLLWFLLLVILIVAIFLGWQTFNEYTPEEEEIFNLKSEAVSIPDTLDMVTWNIGYFGLGAEMDFFYEGGKQVRPSKDLYSKYKRQGLSRIKAWESVDVILLQEVDTFSKRTYFDNQLQMIREKLPHHYSLYAANYNAWVPMPLLEPMGKVNAGILTLLKIKPSNAKRVSFPSSYNWPLRLFQLKRCYLETRFLTSRGKELIIINTHNSAFADAAQLREAELGALKEMMEREYNKGNYVIIGGDWNQNPHPYNRNLLPERFKAYSITPGIPDNFLPDNWKYAYDPFHTTNRNVDTPYKQNQTNTTLIDFFIVSPNIEVIEVSAIENHFSESDHQPVFMKVAL